MHKRASRILLLMSLALTLTCTRQLDSTDNTFYATVQGKVRSLDPLFSNEQYSHLALAQVYEGLMSFHYLKRPLQVEPLLADGWPTISKDGLTYEFKIKKNVYFHDHPAFTNGKGRPITATDFIYSWKRVADPKNKSESFWVFENKIVGLDEWRQSIINGSGKFTDSVPGLLAKDPHTLVIQLKKPYYQLFYILALGMTSVVPHEVVERLGSAFGNSAIGTGPFKLEQWIKGSQIIYSKNQNYTHFTYPSEGSPQDKQKGFLDDAGKALPFVDRLVIYEIPEDQPRWLLFLKGDLDYINCGKDFINKVVANKELTTEFKEKGVNLDLTTSGDIVYISFNTEHPILKNKKIRQAMSLAYNRATSQRDFYSNLGVLAHGPIPPNFEGYRDLVDAPYSQLDLEKAQQLLKEAGFPGGKNLPAFNYEMGSTNSTERQMAEFFKIQMEKIGIKIDLHSNTWPQFTEKVKKKQADIFTMGWNADYPDAENFLQLFYSKNISPGPNGSNFSNKKYDELYEQAKQLPPGEARGHIYQKMEEILMEEAPWIFLIHRSRVIIRHSWIKNYQSEQMVHDRFKYVRVDARERAQQKRKL